MTHIQETIVVEGKDDRSAVLAAVDANIICTSGYGLNDSIIGDIKAAYEKILKTTHDECFWIPLSYTELEIIAPADLKGVEFDYSSSSLPIYKFYY